MNPKDSFALGFCLAILLVFIVYFILSFYDSLDDARRKRNDLRHEIFELEGDKERIKKSIAEITVMEEKK